MTTPALALRVLFVLFVLSCAHAQRKGEWRRLSRTRGFAPFGSSVRPFDPAVNLRICRRRVIRIRLSPRIKDYTGAINKAVRRLRSFRRSPGGTVQLDAGTYLLSGQIFLSSYVCLIGAGRTRTTLKLRARAPPFKYAGMVRSMHTERITVSDLTIDGNRGRQRTSSRRLRYGRFGFFSELSNYLYLRRVGAVNHREYGFDPHGSKRHWAYFLLLEDCYAARNGLDGFALDQTFYVGMSGSVSERNARHGINVITGSRNVVLRNNRVRNNGFASGVGCGVMVQDNQGYFTQAVRIQANTIANSRKAGVCIDEVQNIKLQRNKLSGGPRKAFCYYLFKVRGVSFSRNSCSPPRPGKVARIRGKNNYSGLRR